MIGLYLHIPFCSLLCPYCDFVKAKDRHEDREAFVRALVAEIGQFEGPGEAKSIYFGGGTPSLLTPEQLERIFEALHGRFQLHGPEVTLEANPEDVDDGRLEAWVRLGVTRVSVGVQSLDDASLRFLGRNHDAASAMRACRAVAERFDSWNLDLIFGLPSEKGWYLTLELAHALTPPHLSAYGLTYEPRTPFYQRRGDAVQDDVFLRQYWEVAETLPHLRRYEVSNLAVPGHESRHNLIYWRNEEYAGFGPGAYSFLGGVRARNHASIRRWQEVPGEKCESLALSGNEQRVETVIQGLRLAEGIAHARYEARFQSRMADDFAAPLAELTRLGLIHDDGAAVRPTRRGFELNDEIGLALVQPGLAAQA